MEHFKLDIDNELCLLERYKLEPTELFTVKVILLAQQEGEYEWLQRFAQIIKLRPILESLREKEIILKSWKIPKEGTKLDIEDIPFNKNFIKQFYRASFEMGEELFYTYPQSCTVQGQVFNLRTVSKHFDSLEQAFQKYAKSIKNNPEIHQEVIDNIKWGIENGYNFTTLDRFIIDRGGEALKSFREGNSININLEATQLI